MNNKLEKDQVDKLAAVLHSARATAHAYDSLRLLHAWQLDASLNMSPETRKMINDLIAEFDPKFPN